MREISRPAGRHRTAPVTKAQLGFRTAMACGQAVEYSTVVMRKPSERSLHSDPYPFIQHEDIPAFEAAPGEQRSTPPPNHAAERRLSLMGDRSESNARSYAACPGSGTGPSRFLGGNPWKKPNNRVNYCRAASLWQGFCADCLRRSDWSVTTV